MNRVTDILSYEFKGKRLGWNWKLTLLPWATEDRVITNEYDFPEKMVIAGSMKLSRKMQQELPFGMNEASTLKFKIDLTRIEDVEVRNFIMVSDSYPERCPRLPFHAGESYYYQNKWILYSDRGSGAAADIVEFEGFQTLKPEEEYTYGSDTQEVEIECVGIDRVALESVRSGSVITDQQQTTSKIIGRRYVDDSINKTISEILHPYGNVNADMIRITDVMNAIEDAFNSAAKVLAAEDLLTVEDFTITGEPIDSLTLYEQTDSKTNAIGDAILSNVSVILRSWYTITTNEYEYDQILKVNSGAERMDNEDSVNSRCETLWDLLKKMAEMFCMKLTYNYTSRDFAFLKAKGGAVANLLIADVLSGELKLLKRANTTSNVKAIDKAVDGDNEIEVNERFAGSRSDKSYEYESIFSNAEKGPSTARKETWHIRHSEGFDLLYYQNGETYNTNPVYQRVHDYHVMKLDDSEVVGALVPADYYQELPDWSDNIIMDIYDYNQNMKELCLSKTNCVAISMLIGTMNQLTAKGTWGVDKVGCQDIGKEVTVNLSALDANWTQSRGKVVTMDIDPEMETNDLTLFVYGG